jgi:Na+-transporting NADH:ubiquinone oxidoreductase subunit C
MKSPFWSVVFMLLISSLCAGILEFVHLSTRDRVERNEALALQREVLAAFGLLAPGAAPDQIKSQFESSVDTEENNGRVRWILKTGDRAGSLAFPIEGMGFWATIHAIVAVGRDGRTITGIRFYKHGETPGLGGRISEAWFMKQFQGKRLGADTPLRLVKPGEPRGENDVDAITGATQTSSKVQRLLNQQAVEALTKAGP